MIVRSMIFAGALALGTSAMAAEQTVTQKAMLAELQAAGDDGSTPRPIRAWFTGSKPGLDKASDFLAANGWRGIEMHLEDRQPFFAGYVMSKADAASIAELRAKISTLQSTYGVQLASIKIGQVK